MPRRRRRLRNAPPDSAPSRRRRRGRGCGPTLTDPQGSCLTFTVAQSGAEHPTERDGIVQFPDGPTL